MIDVEAWSCPAPAPRGERVLLGHGAGGRLSSELVEQLFRPAFANPLLDAMGDAAVLDLGGGTALAFATDSHVVSPLFFPGGSIGELAVYGTVNDLAMMGAWPLYLSAGFILEEGLELAVLERVVAAMGLAAQRCGVSIVTGDTKVVERGKGDGLFVNTAGIGRMRPGFAPAPHRAQVGDVVLVSGPIAQHGIAVLSLRHWLELETSIVSDSAPLHELVATLAEACPEVHVLRDPTRGGVAAALHEIAKASGVGVELDEARLPVDGPVAAICELLGLDPLHVANEGRLLAVVPAPHAEAALEALRSHPSGAQACRIGRVVEGAGVQLRTVLGACRVVDLPLAEPLPRIC